jgi:hypothetical protein
MRPVLELHPSNQWDFNWADQIGLNNPATGNRPLPQLGLSKLKNEISLALDKIITQFFLFCDHYDYIYQIGYELSWSMELEILVWHYFFN